MLKVNIVSFLLIDITFSLSWFFFSHFCMILLINNYSTLSMDVTISTNEEVVVIHLFWGIKPFISWNFLIDLRQVIVLQWECFVSSSSRNPSQICSGQSFEHQHHTSVMAASRETQWSHTGYFIAKIVDQNQCFIVFTSQASLICINLPFKQICLHAFDRDTECFTLCKLIYP